MANRLKHPAYRFCLIMTVVMTVLTGVASNSSIVSAVIFTVGIAANELLYSMFA